MKTKEFLLLATAALVAACQNEVPMSVEIPLEQVEIAGKQSGNVRLSESGVLVVRDSVPDEYTTTEYVVRASVRLKLDSAFLADKMEEALTMQFTDMSGKLIAEMHPADSCIADSLYAFLLKAPEDSIDIAFLATLARDQFVQLSKDVHAVMSGFTFHPDPDAEVITGLLEEYQNLGVELKKHKKSNGDYRSSAIPLLLKMENADKVLVKLNKKLTVWQIAKYQALHEEHYHAHWVDL